MTALQDATTLEELEAAVQAFADSRAEKTRQAEQDAKDAERVRSETITAMAKNLVPPALRPFTQVVDDIVIEINLPQYAIIKHRLYVSDAWDGKRWIVASVTLSNSASDNNWRVYQWTFYKDDLEDIHPALMETCETLEEALAVARNLGDNREAAWKEMADFKEKKSDNPEPAPAPSAPRFAICPLMQTRCVRDECAWWYERYEGKPESAHCAMYELAACA